MRLLALLLGITILLVGGLWSARVRHERQIGGIWRSLLSEPDPAQVFSLAAVEGLPEPARRYLEHAIAPGTPLAKTVVLRLTGTLRLRADDAPLRMESEEVLTPPLGFVWRARVGEGLSTIQGFDRYAAGVGEMRWWLAGLVPVVSSSGPDVTRSAWGRMLGEAVLIPSALLPARGAEWSAVDDSTAVVRIGPENRAVELTLDVDTEGRLRSVQFLRWNGDAANGPIGEIAFRMEALEGEVTFDGYTVPARFKAGWVAAPPKAEEDKGPTSDFAFFDARIELASYR